MKISEARAALRSLNMRIRVDDGVYRVWFGEDDGAERRASEYRATTVEDAVSTAAVMRQNRGR